MAMQPQPMHDASGTITTGGEAQTVLAENWSRTYLFVLNISDANMYVDFGVDAVADQPSIPLPPGGAMTFEGSYVPTNSVSIFCADADKGFVVKHAG